MNRNPLILRGKTVREDQHGRLCLEDVFALASGLPTKAPARWRSKRNVRALVEELRRKVSLTSVANSKPAVAVIDETPREFNALTFAHPILAAAYAGFLSAKLEIEVREIWLRFRQGDATLADEILQRASAQDNKWAGTRALGRAQRNAFTDTLKEHGVVDRGYMDCTEMTYIELLGGRSYEVRKRRGLPAKSNLREHIDQSELAFIMAAESLSAERIRDEDRRGNAECADATRIGAKAIRNAIEQDRQARRKSSLA